LFILLSLLITVFLCGPQNVSAVTESEYGSGASTHVMNVGGSSGSITSFSDLVSKINGVLAGVVPVIFGVALIYFLWNLTQFILNMDNEDARKKARDHMVWGIVALFVMVSVWGLVGVLTGTFNFAGNSTAPVPSYPGY
jgi:hypothetical protein